MKISYSVLERVGPFIVDPSFLTHLDMSCDKYFISNYQLRNYLKKQICDKKVKKKGKKNSYKKNGPEIL